MVYHFSDHTNSDYSQAYSRHVHCTFPTLHPIHDNTPTNLVSARRDDREVGNECSQPHSCCPGSIPLDGASDKIEGFLSTLESDESLFPRDVNLDNATFHSRALDRPEIILVDRIKYLGYLPNLRSGLLTLLGSESTLALQDALSLSRPG